MDDVDIKHRDALAREMCVWGNPGGLCVTHEDHTGVGRVKEPCGVGKTSAWMLISSTDTAPTHLGAPMTKITITGRATADATLRFTPSGAAVASFSLADTEPEIVEAMDSGALSINLAAQVADLPKEEQAIVAAAPVESIKEVAREAVKKAHVANNSGNNEWYTPADYIALAREVMGGIDTDPATSEIANRTVQAAQIFTAEDNGLTKQWSGRVWCNPPYAQPLIAEFAEAIASKFEAGEIEQACVLVNNGTETRWFQRMLQAASAVCFPRSRIRFVDPEGNPSGAPLQGQAVLYLGNEPETFASVFSEKGAVLFNG